jgi:hypothetical protein
LRKSEELEELKIQKVWAAQKGKEYQLKNIDNVYEAERKQAVDEFVADKEALREKMMNSCVDKWKKLTEEKNTLNLTVDLDRTSRSSSRRKRSTNSIMSPNAKDQANGKKRLAPPQINYMLKETEIVEDLALIQKATSNHPNNYGKYHGKQSSSIKDISLH